MVRRIVLLAFTVSLLCVPSAHAASIFLPDISNELIALVFNPAGPPPPDSVVADLAGTATGTIYDGATLTPLSNAQALTDPADPAFGSGVVLGTPTPAALSIAFDFGSAVFTNGVLTLLGTGSGLTPLDAALAAFNGPVLGTFGLVFAEPSGELGDALEFYQLTSIVGDNAVTAIPEPASLTLLGIGLAGVAARRRKAGRK